jgi:type IV pilus assembly protein PilZ
VNTKHSPEGQNGTQKEERRTESRLPVELDASVGTNHSCYGGLAENLSVRGVFVATHLIRSVGESLELGLHLPGRSEPLRVVGKVRWVRTPDEKREQPPGMGLELEPLTEADARLLHAYVTMLKGP